MLTHGLTNCPPLQESVTGRTLTRIMRYQRLLEILLIDETESNNYQFLTQIFAPELLPEKLIVTKGGIVFRGESDELITKVVHTIASKISTKLDVFSEHLTITEIPSGVNTEEKIELYLIQFFNLITISRNIVHVWNFHTNSP